MNGGQLIAQVLQNHGVQHLFTLCGGHIAPIYVEAEKNGIQVIDVRDEASAVFAADATARLTGIPGVVAVTAGPGVTNSITALKNAQMAQSPVLLLGGATATLLRNRGALQDIDQMALVKPHVKWATIVKRQREIAPALNQAMRIARSGVPGPVFVELPVDLLYNEETVREWYGKKNTAGASLMEKIIQWYINRHVNGLFSGMQDYTVPGAEKPQVPDFTQTEVNAVASEVKRARRPVMIISSGAMMEAGNARTLCAAVKRLGIPVYLSGMARGLAGHVSEVQYRHKRRMALREADCILLCGVPVDFRLDYGSHLNRKARKITINRSREELKKNIAPHKAVLADPGAFLIGLSGAADAFPGWEDWKQQLQNREDAREEEILQTAKQTIEGINPVALFRKMEALIPDNSVLIADGGDFAATASYTLRPRRPLAWLDPGVFGTLGVGGGFAIGAALHYPDDYIWIIYGDGSAAYSLMEMDTFKKYGMKVCGIIGNNGSWEQIARDQVALLGTDTATTLPRSDYQKVAEAFGAAGERVDHLEGFEGALKRAMESMDKGIPYVINAIIGSTDFRQGSISM
ncbi:MAG: thiamine pyrophosphate-binding protein [Lewinellaceae bacterium]|nr:thiamine pyrophosphate-binding protein [Phaeodactylibacter sp.]MCB9035109.1 thiamine pyrophosphate-binding protein [Lewinellaceae bacterium]